MPLLPQQCTGAATLRSQLSGISRTPMSSTCIVWPHPPAPTPSPPAGSTQDTTAAPELLVVLPDIDITAQRPLQQLMHALSDLRQEGALRPAIVVGAARHPQALRPLLSAEGARAHAYMRPEPYKLPSSLASLGSLVKRTQVWTRHLPCTSPPPRSRTERVAHEHRISDILPPALVQPLAHGTLVPHLWHPSAHSLVHDCVCVLSHRRAPLAAAVALVSDVQVGPRLRKRCRAKRRSVGHDSAWTDGFIPQPKNSSIGSAQLYLCFRLIWSSRRSLSALTSSHASHASSLGRACARAHISSHRRCG